jgi:crossover junction endodeoxyribonuclease RusA
VKIEVHGIPAPQGSKRHVGGGRMVEMSRALGPWREAVRTETQRVMREQFAPAFPAGQPVCVQIEFYLPRPKSTPAKIRYPVKRPDADKLARAVLDAMTDAGAWADDSQVTWLQVSKAFADDQPAGCTITAEEEL